MAVHDSTKLITAEEFWEIARRPENELRRLELVNGVIQENEADMAPSSNRNTVTAMTIGSYLTVFVREHNLGYVSGADGGFELGPNDVRQPDVGFISKERLSDLSGKWFPAAPDLAVEVISPSESAQMVQDKIWAYLQAGTRIVLAVYPETKTVDKCRLDAGGKLIVERLQEGDTFDGGEVLPGFTLPVKNIFP